MSRIPGEYDTDIIIAAGFLIALFLAVGGAVWLWVSFVGAGERLVEMNAELRTGGEF